MYQLGIDTSAVSTTALFDLGQIGATIESTGTKVWKYVQYEAATAAVAGVAGEVAYYYLLDGYKDNIVTSDLSDATGDIGAGVLPVNVADGEYTWIQIKGSATLSIALTAGADGDPLTPTGAGDGTLDVNVATAANTHICAHAGDISDKEIICEFPF